VSIFVCGCKSVCVYVSVCVCVCVCVCVSPRAWACMCMHARARMDTCERTCASVCTPPAPPLVCTHLHPFDPSEGGPSFVGQAPLSLSSLPSMGPSVHCHIPHIMFIISQVWNSRRRHHRENCGLVPLCKHPTGDVRERQPVHGRGPGLYPSRQLPPRAHEGERAYPSHTPFHVLLSVCARYL
jgi:hypothetical protein